MSETAKEVNMQCILLSEQGSVVVMELNTFIGMVQIGGRSVDPTKVVQSAYVTEEGDLAVVTDVVGAFVVPLLIPSGQWKYAN